MKPILIIEDDREIRETLKSFLETEGYPVMAAENGKSGLDKIQNKITPSLIFLDLFMPQMSGLEFLRNYNRLDVKSPVVLCTACPQDHEEFIAASAYSDYALQKPLDIDKVLELAEQYSKPNH